MPLGFRWVRVGGLDARGKKRLNDSIVCFLKRLSPRDTVCADQFHHNRRNEVTSVQSGGGGDSRTSRFLSFRVQRASSAEEVEFGFREPLARELLQCDLQFKSCVMLYQVVAADIDR